MHVTACLAGQDEVDVEVGEDCRTIQALQESIVKALPQLCVEGFDVSVGGRELGRPRPTRGRHTRRPGGHVVCTGIDIPGSNVFPASRPVWQWGGTRYNFYLSTAIDEKDGGGRTPLYISCENGHVETATLLLDRGRTAIDEKGGGGINQPEAFSSLLSQSLLVGAPRK